MKKLLILLGVIMLLFITNASAIKWYANITYDNFSDSSINSSLWTNSSPVLDSGNGINASVKEYSGYLEVKATDCRSSGISTSQTATTINLPVPVSFIGSVHFVANASVSGSSIGSGTSVGLTAFGTNINFQGASAGSNSRNYSILWNGTTHLFYQEGVLQSSLSGSNSNLTFTSTARSTSYCSITASILDLFALNYSYGEGTMNISLSKSPVTAGSLYLVGESINFNVSSSTAINQLKNATMYINGVANGTNNFSGSSNYTIFQRQLPASGDYNWSAYVCDSDDNCKLSNQDTFTITSLTADSITYNSNAYETANEQIIGNFSLDSAYTTVTATLIYDGSSYVSNVENLGTTIVLTNNISIPLITSVQNKTFYWNISLDGAPVQSLSYNQTVDYLNISSCGGSITTSLLNFTAYLEENLTRVNPYAFAGYFEYWLGDGTVKKTSGVQSTSTAEMIICSNVPDRDISSNVDVSYYFDSANLTLLSRNYYLQDATLNNVTQSIPLYLLNAEDATTFILKVQNKNNQPVSNALINILRFYPGEGIYRTVQVARTDDNGATVGFYQTETVDYKHIISKDGVVLLETGSGKVVGESVPFTLIFTVGEAIASPWSFLSANTSIQTALSYNQTSQIVTFSFIDPTGLNNYARLYVYQSNLKNSTLTTICDTSTVGSAGTIVCNMTGQTGTFIAKGYVFSSSTLTNLLNFIVTNAREIFGNTGGILGWFIILTVSLAVLWNPSVGIIVIDAAIIFVGFTGLLIFSPITYFAIIGVSIILLWMFKT